MTLGRPAGSRPRSASCTLSPTVTFSRKQGKDVPSRGVVCLDSDFRTIAPDGRNAGLDAGSEEDPDSGGHEKCQTAWRVGERCSDGRRGREGGDGGEASGKENKRTWGFWDLSGRDGTLSPENKEEGIHREEGGGDEKWRLSRVQFRELEGFADEGANSRKR